VGYNPGMGWFTYIFFGALALNLGLKFWLDARQKRAVLQHRDSVPAAFAGRVTLEEHQKAADYVVASLKEVRWDRALQTVLLLVWTVGGGIALLDDVWRRAFHNPLLVGVFVALSLFVVDWAAWIPSKYRQTFGLEQRFGFNRSTRKTFIADQLKVLALTVVFVAALATAALWLMKATGALWWLWLWGLWLGSMLLLIWAYPRWIAPMFNKLKPLEDGALKQRITALIERCGFRSDGVFVMDGSRRSTRGNAYFGGMGRNKRIVFYDTLLAQLDEDEIEAVLAHELGHFRLRHNVKSIAVSSLFILGCAALLGWVHGQPWFYRQLGVKRPSDYAALLLFIQIAPTFFALLKPLSTLLSRRHEFQADAFAAAHASGGKLAEGLVKMTRENAGTLTPDPLYSSFHYSHPPVPERVARLQPG
jgi:STE24 endopeptidase